VAGWFKAFGQQGITPIFRENSKKKHIGVKKMTSYTVTGKEEIEAAKEKNIFIILYLAAKCKNAIKKK